MLKATNREEGFAAAFGEPDVVCGRLYCSLRKVRLFGPGGFGVQLIAVIGLMTFFAAALYGLYTGLSARGYRFDFGFLSRPAGIEISEGYVFAFADEFSLRSFASSDTNAQAIATGIYNTLKVTIVGIAASTLLGVSVALGRTSTNWLLRQLCFVYVEVVRNTPLLIQLAVWYFAVILKLPPFADASSLYGILFVSRQGIVVPSIELRAVSSGVAGGLVVGMLFACAFAALPILNHAVRRTIAWSAGAIAFALMLGGFVVAELPALDRFDAIAGTKLSPEMVALLLALTVNTAAFIAEAVRGAIESIPKGQWEAAVALGMRRRTIQRHVVIPQVFRIVLPSLGNQYISLAKSTSFGIAIGYPDLFNIYGTVANQTGRTLEGMTLVIVCYLLLSWSISASVNFLNLRMLKRGGAR